MKVYLSELIEQLMDLVAWQETPEELEYEDYEKIIRRSVRRLYTDTARREYWPNSIMTQAEYDAYYNPPEEITDDILPDDPTDITDDDEDNDEDDVSTHEFTYGRPNFDDDTDEEQVAYLLRDNIDADEYEYILMVAQIMFFRKVKTDVNRMVSYTTNALSVTGGDKPYAHLKDTIDELESMRREMYHRMTRWTMEYD